jgi:hypothetical protein
MSTNKDKQIAQLSAQVIALTALVAKTIEQQQAPATKGKAKKAATTPRAGNAWSAFSGALSRRVTALIKEGYADDARWESEKGAKDGCKRAGFQLRVAGLIKREYDLDDGEGGYLDPEDEQIIGAIEHLLDNPEEQSATAEARGGMSVTQLKAAGMKIAKPSAAKPVAKPVAKPTPVKKAAPAPEPEAESETEDEAEEAPAPVPAPKAAAAKKSPKAATKAAPKSAVLAAAAEVAEVAEEVKEAEAPASALEEPTEDDLKEAGLVKFKNPNSKVWYLRTVEEPKRCYLGGPEKENIAKAWANFKAGICAGIWSKNDKGKLDICPVESSA